MPCKDKVPCKNNHQQTLRPTRPLGCSSHVEPIIKQCNAMQRQSQSADIIFAYICWSADSLTKQVVGVHLRKLSEVIGHHLCPHQILINIYPSTRGTQSQLDCNESCNHLYGCVMEHNPPPFFISSGPEHDPSCKQTNGISRILLIS